MGNKTGNKSGKEFIFVGLALFAMFFGAGNLIFPPELGVKAGPLWWLGFICFMLADAGLATLGVIAMGLVDGDINNVTGPIGKKASVILNTVVIICIGPGVAIPRTATVSYGLGAAPVFGLAPDGLPLAIYSAIFFIIVLALTIKPSKVVDIVGKVLTPVLVVVLLVMIIIGFVHPGGSIQAPIDGYDAAETVRYGISQGYQTMDGMASLFFGIIIIMAVRGNGYTERSETTTQVLKASIVSGVLLFIVYGGLAYLGATTGTLWKADVANGAIDQANLVSNIVNQLMGYPGTCLLGIAILLACLTTSIGLTSSAADYFSDFVAEEKKEKVYKATCIIVCVVSFLLSNLGLAHILAIAAPILSLVYPLVIFLLIASLFRKWLRKKMAYRLGAIAAFVVSILTVFSAANGGFFGVKVAAFDFINSLPLAPYGFNWVIPTIIFMVIGCLLPSEEIDKLAGEK